MSAQGGTLGYDGPNPSWWEGGLPRSLPPRAAPLAGLTAELNTDAAEGRKVLSWFSEVGLVGMGRGGGHDLM